MPCPPYSARPGALYADWEASWSRPQVHRGGNLSTALRKGQQRVAQAIREPNIARGVAGQGVMDALGYTPRAGCGRSRPLSPGQNWRWPTPRL